MQIRKDVSLKRHSTMRLGGLAAYLVTVKNKAELVKAVDWAQARQLPVRTIGTGSNIIWRDEGFPGLVIVNRIEGFKKVAEDAKSATYRIGAGEPWDHVVARAVRRKLKGIECLSLIPGTAGACPVQNVGAYGQDISQTLVELEAYDRRKQKTVTIPAHDCGFGYRTSRFKTTDNGRFIILSITLKLGKGPSEPPFYDALQRYFDERKQKNPSLAQIRRAVIAIRSSKLPDPAKVANNGSFFANPIVSASLYQRVKKSFPELKAWPVEKSRYKLSAAWLVETAGFKGKKDAKTGMSTWKHQALVLVNESATSTKDLLTYQRQIMQTVHRMFGVELEREPELLP